MSNSKKGLGLIGWLLLCGLAGVMGIIFQPGTWYGMLSKPGFTPPNWIFPVVWPILYVLMAVAAWLIWKDFGFTEGRRPLEWFCMQLALNAAWSWLFFGRHTLLQ